MPIQHTYVVFSHTMHVCVYVYWWFSCVPVSLLSIPVMWQSTPVTKALYQSISSEHDRQFLLDFTQKYLLQATLLPMKTVGVQGDSRTYSLPAALSCSTQPPWEDLITLAKIIPKVLHNVNRWVQGQPQVTCCVNTYTLVCSLGVHVRTECIQLYICSLLVYVCTMSYAL